MDNNLVNAILFLNVVTFGLASIYIKAAPGAESAAIVVKAVLLGMTLANFALALQ